MIWLTRVSRRPKSRSWIAIRSLRRRASTTSVALNTFVIITMNCSTITITSITNHRISQTIITSHQRTFISTRSWRNCAKIFSIESSLTTVKDSSQKSLKKTARKAWSRQFRRLLSQWQFHRCISIWYFHWLWSCWLISARSIYSFSKLSTEFKFQNISCSYKQFKYKHKKWKKTFDKLTFLMLRLYCALLITALNYLKLLRVT